MNDRFQYRLSRNQKFEIAQNLIEILQKDATITKLTSIFIGNWLLTDHAEKRKAFYDVWDIVLKNYLPATRPVLFRTCERISKTNKIASFTSRLECARRISNGKGCLIICDTKETLQFEDDFHNPGEYKHTFYPLVNVLKKAKDSARGEFSEKIFDFIGEDEYIMRIDTANIRYFRWMKNNS